MQRQIVLLMVLLGLLLCPVSHAANIIWVSQAYDTDVDGVQDDLEAEDFVRSLGHELDVQRGNWTALDATKIAALNAADLIIVSRSTDSAQYATDAAEVGQWDSVTTPMINMTSYLARNSRWLWANTTTVNNLVGPTMDVLLPEHPIFTGVDLGANNTVQLVDGTTGVGQTSFLGMLDVGSGTVIVSTGTNACIVEWPAGEAFYSGAGTPAGNRMLFCMGTQESGATPQGKFNLTETGKAVFANAILYMMGEDIEPGRASSPNPEDGAMDVPRDVVLGWKAGENVATQDVYFGTSLDDVTAASPANPMGLLVSQGQAGAGYVLADLLDFNQTYYWRIDGFEAGGTTYTGNVWSFTTEPMAYAIENIIATTNGDSDEGSGPERTVDGSGLNDADGHSVEAGDMWLAYAPEDEPFWIQYEFDKVYKLYELLVWNYNVMFESVLGFGVKDVTIEYSVDGTDWAVLADVQFARATAKANYAANTVVDLEGVAAKFVRLNVNSAYGSLGQYGLSEVRFTYTPVQAREPQPADGAVNVDPAAGLSWRAGREAISHEVYFGTDQNDLPLAGSPAQAAFTLAELLFGTTYYWRVDEVGDGDVWAGDLWSFATQEFALIDGFETYTDDIDAGEAIFDTWLDGWVNNTGSTVGYITAPFAEKTIVHSGSQSMPLQYDNTGSPFYSEAERQFASPQNWTGNGAETLRLFVAGEAPAFVESADGAIVMNGIGTDIWNETDEFRYAHKNLSGNGSITARVDYLDASANSWVKVGVMIRQNAEAGAVNVFMALTGGDGGGATFQQRMTAGGASVSQHTYEDGPLAPPYWVRVTREGNTLQGYTSPDGETWTPRGDTITLAMADPVLIGLAVTSHNADQATSGEFSNVTFTGNVAGNWEVSEIGVAQPATGNVVAPLYVTLTDATGQTATVTHPNANIVGRSGWTEWQIPMSEFAGVNPSRVDTMVIGVGNRTSPSAGGTGIVYIDEVGFGKPAAQ